MAVSEKAKWTRLAALGLFLAGLGPTLILLASLIWRLDLEGDLTFMVVTALIGFVGAFLVLQFGTWSKFVGILFGILLAMALWWTVFGLAQPASFFDFLPGLLVLPGALLAIVASIMALVAQRRGRVAARPEGGERRAIQVVAGIVVVAALVSGAMSLFGRSTASAGDAAASSSMKDFQFDQEQYQVAGGSRIFVKNDDPFFHTFSIDDLDVNEGFVAGRSKVIDIPTKPGTYILYCQPHTFDKEEPEEDDMAATITVT